MGSSASLAQQLLLLFLVVHFLFATFLTPHAAVRLALTGDRSTGAGAGQAPPRQQQGISDQLASFAPNSRARSRSDVRGGGRYTTGGDAAAASSSNHHLGAVVFLGPQRLRAAFGHTRVCLLQKAVESVDLHLNAHYGPYPVFIVVASDHALDPEGKDGPYTAADRADLVANLRHGTDVTFVEVPMYSGDALEAGLDMEQFERWNRGSDGGTGGRPLGYRSMCRLWSGRLQRMDFLRPYGYYMRLDDDSFLTDDFASDPFLDMQERSLQYAYRRPYVDTHGVDYMWELARPYFDDEAHMENMIKIGMLRRMADGSVRYRGQQPYNNFHVASVSMWSRPKWLAFTEEAERNFAFFKHRFGDANVHAFAMGLLLRPEEVGLWNAVPYVHNINDMPNYPPAEWAGRCGNLAVFRGAAITVVGGSTNKLVPRMKVGT